MATMGITLLVLFLSACGEIIPKFPNTPRIEFISIQKVSAQVSPGEAPRDTVFINFKFQDGDGDIGSPNDSDPNDFFASPFKLYNGDTIPVEFDPGPSVSYNGNLPQLKKDGRAGPIEGTVNYRILITPPLLDLDPSKNINPGDTILFEIRIRDQADNMSNTVSTTGIQVLRR